MDRYEHTQRTGILYYLIFLGGALTFSTFYFARVLPWIVPALMIALLAAFMLTFRSLTVRVDPNRNESGGDGGAINLNFGFGWPAKSIPLDSVVGTKLVENRWFYGFGVRMTPHGWMWNVSGFKAVELEYSDSTRFRIGSDEPERLQEAIQRAIKK